MNTLRMQSATLLVRCYGAITATVVLLVALTACDPCSGVISCSSPPFIAIDGQMVETTFGQGVDGVRIDVIRRSGVALESDSTSTVTASGGLWRVVLVPATAGDISADVVVTTNAGVTYRVGALTFRTLTRRGEANVLERWVVDPYFPDVAELFTEGTTDERVQGATVEFRRTGGLEFHGPLVANGVVTATTDAAGRIPLVSRSNGGVFTSGLGTTVGDLVVRRTPSDSAVVRGLQIRSTFLYHEFPGIVRLAIPR